MSLWEAPWKRRHVSRAGGGYKLGNGGWAPESGQFGALDRCAGSWGWAGVAHSHGSREVPASLYLVSPPCPSPPPSVAKALGVNTVGAQALKLFYEHPILSEVISDQEAVTAIEKFVGTFCGIFPPLIFSLLSLDCEWTLKPVSARHESCSRKREPGNQDSREDKLVFKVPVRSFLVPRVKGER